MLRVKIIKPHPKYKLGEIYHLTKNEAFGLLDSGQAILTKDITESETKTKDGKSRIIRTDNFGGRKRESWHK